MTDDAKIKGGVPARSKYCYQTTRDIVIPAGTILRGVSGDDRVKAAIGLPGQPDVSLVVVRSVDAQSSGYFRLVIA